MKLSTFEKVNTATRTYYNITSKDGTEIDFFYVYYLDREGKPNNTDLLEQIEHLKKYYDAKVEMVTFSSALNHLSVYATM